MTSETHEAPDSRPPWTAKELYRTYGNGVIPLITVDKIGDEHIGSAFHVGEGVFVTAAHVVEDQASVHAGQQLVNAHRHSDPVKDVAVFKVPGFEHLPIIPLGGHLDDWINDGDFVLNEILVLGYPPIPLAASNPLVASRGQVNAVVDLINIPHVHFIASTMARGGFSGGVVLSEWGVALGVVTSSLVHNQAVEELGYLTVLTVEPILECLGQAGLMPLDLTNLWQGLFTSKTEYYGRPDLKWAHSWIETDRDGHQASIKLACPDPQIIEAAMSTVAKMPNFPSHYSIEPIDVHRWKIDLVYEKTVEPLERYRFLFSELLTSSGYLRVERPSLTVRQLEIPELLSFDADKP